MDAHEPTPKEIYNSYQRKGREDVKKRGYARCLENLLDRFSFDIVNNDRKGIIYTGAIKGIAPSGRKNAYSCCLFPVLPYGQGDFASKWVNHFTWDWNSDNDPKKVRVLDYHGILYVEHGIKRVSAAISRQRASISAMITPIRAIRPKHDMLHNSADYFEFCNQSGISIFYFNDSRHYKTISQSLEGITGRDMKHATMRLDRARQKWVSGYLDFLHKFPDIPVERAGDTYMGWVASPEPVQGRLKTAGQAIKRVLLGT